MSDQRANPQAVAQALRAIKAYVRQYPKHARWIIEGHPGLTDQEHYDRFGKPVKKGDLS